MRAPRLKHSACLGCITLRLELWTMPAITETPRHSRGRVLCASVSLWLLIAVSVFPQKKPEITVTPNRIKSGDAVLLTGTGFTPNRSVMSHLRRPDGSEYNPLRLRTNERGELVH